MDAPVPRKAQPFPSDHLRAKNWGQKLRIERKRSNSTVSVTDSTQPSSRRKRKHVEAAIVENSKQGNPNFTTCLRFSGMIFLEFLDENEMVIVEQPWLGIVNSLPDALERQRYGS